MFRSTPSDFRLAFGFPEPKMPLSAFSSSTCLPLHADSARRHVSTRRRLLTIRPYRRRQRSAAPSTFDFRRGHSFSRRLRITSEIPKTNESTNPITSLADADQTNNTSPPDPPIPDTAPTSISTTEDVEADPTTTSATSEKVVDNNVRFNLFGMEMAVPARLMLFTVPIMWGSFGPVVRLLFEQEPHLDPTVFNTVRLFLSCAVYMPILIREYAAYSEIRANEEKGIPPAEEDSDRFSFILAGLELGLYVFGANVSQVVGLEQVSAARAAFLVQLQTVIVPVLSGIFGLDAVTRNTLISSFIAVAGVALLSLDKGHGSVSSLSGDALEILSAVFFSAFILRLGRYVSRGVRTAPLVAWKICVQTILCTTYAAGQTFLTSANAVNTGDLLDGPAEWTQPIVALNVFGMLWTGLVCSALGGWVQSKGQEKVPASTAVVIFAMQPLWASAMAAVVLGESFGTKGVLGGGLIVASTIVAGIKTPLGQRAAKED